MRLASSLHTYLPRMTVFTRVAVLAAVCHQYEFLFSPADAGRKAMHDAY